MSSSPSTTSSPELPTKRKRQQHDDPESDDDSDADDSSADSDSESDSEPPPQDSVPDEPVLSHKQKRLAKRQAKADAKASSKKKRKLPDGSAAPVNNTGAKRQHSVWVGNLNFKTTPESLTAFFKDAGEVTRVNMPHKRAAGPGLKPENQGFAYVDFTSADAKVAAIAMSEQNLLGRKLLIKDGDDFAGRPTISTPGDAAVAAATATAGSTGLTKSAQRILRAQKQPPAPTLFLGNLPFETTEDTIRGLFDAHRKLPKKGSKDGDGDDPTPEAKPEQWIRKVRMGTFEDSGLCKGFAFIDFTSTEHATAALTNLRNHHLNGRDLKVEYASPDAVKRGEVKKRDPDGAPKRRKEPKRSGPRAEKRIKREQEGGTAEQEPPKPKKRNADRDEKKFKSKEERHLKGPKNRPRPGAALAEAKRESAAILPAQGKKIVF
ncbi:hypothetical protein MKEN_00684400 [Mycena kentingensis (nom. inval.)]|nr:hypothetical protein MKEN_00684400 [Mycena kentingensis (nom. inval.)]